MPTKTTPEAITGWVVVRARDLRQQAFTYEVQWIEPSWAPRPMLRFRRLYGSGYRSHSRVGTGAYFNIIEEA